MLNDEIEKIIIKKINKKITQVSIANQQNSWSESWD
jgi:hypothetical protein